MGVLDRIKTAWNAFRADASEIGYRNNIGPSSGIRADRPRMRLFNDKTIVAAIAVRIAIDVASIDIRHVKLDAQSRYSADADGPLNDCLTWEPNLDQGPRSFKQDLVQAFFDSGSAAIVPVDTSLDPFTNEVVDIYTLRVGQIVAWYPKHVRVSLYNEAVGQRQEITLEKRFVAIVENPLYDVMNAPNSTLQRLIRKLTLLDSVDEATGSGKLDLIIQLPYVIKSDARRAQAEKRREEIEFQLKGSKYGIAYTDGTEKVTQLNRPAENNLLTQIEYLTNMLYGQLGITEQVMNGTADEPTMINYYNRTIQPIAQAVVESMQRTFLGPAGKQRSERIMYFRNPFQFVPLTKFAEIVDKLVRNEVLTANEIRGYMGVPPSTDPRADQLVNPNMPAPTQVQLVPHNGDPSQQPALPAPATEKQPALPASTASRT